MRVGWLTDPSPYIGGAELTQAEFRAAAPEGVEVIDCPPGGVVAGLGTYVIHNHMTYSDADLIGLTGRTVRYYHDVRPQKVDPCVAIFSSPLSHERSAHRIDKANCHLIPPAIDYHPFANTWGPNEGACWIGHFQNAGKGITQAVEWAEANQTILNFYGEGPYRPADSEYVRVHNAIPHSEVPSVLSQYETFVHLPIVIEPFGRSVVEAWAAGHELVVNRNVGARYWLEEKPEAFSTAAADFWNVVLG